MTERERERERETERESGDRVRETLDNIKEDWKKWEVHSAVPR